MTEHGLTTGEATARLCGIVRSLHYYGDPPDIRLRADVDADVQAVVDAAYTLADTLCARHLREAVEEADNTALLSLPCTCGEDGDVDVRAFRAALLDALTGEGM